MSQIIRTGNNIFTIGGKIYRFDKPAESLLFLDKVSSSEGALSNPYGITLDLPSAAFPNGRILVGNNNSTVSIINYMNPRAGSPISISQVQGTFSVPTSVTIDLPSSPFPNGRIFVTNFISNTVSILNYLNPQAGSPVVISQTQGAFSNPVFSAIDLPSAAFPNGRIFVTNFGSNTVSILNYLNPQAGSPVMISQTQGAFNGPRGIMLDAANNRIFIANYTNNTVSILNYSNPQAGSPVVISQTQGAFSAPYGIALDPANNRILVVNFTNSTVSILNYSNPQAGSPVVISQTQGSFSGPRGIVLDPAKNRSLVSNNESTISILNYNFN